MSVAASVAQAVAARVEKTGGPRAGLVAWRALASGSADPEARGLALVAMLRCAIVLGDRVAVAEATKLWASIDRGVWWASIASTCRALVRAGWVVEATSLASVEVERHRTARALYLHARCLALGGAEPRAVGDRYQQAIERAQREGSVALERTARVRRAELLARSWETMAEALQEAQRVDLGQASSPEQLVILGILLLAPSRFVRATAITALDELVMADDDGIACAALVSVARFVDASADQLTPLELDRIVALFGRERARALAPDGKEALKVLVAIVRAHGDAEAFAEALHRAADVEPALGPLHARARDVVRGRFEAEPEKIENQESPIAPKVPRAILHTRALDVAVALRDRRFAAARLALSSIVEAEPLTPTILSVAHASLVETDPELRAVAVRLFARYLRQVSAAPRGGYMALSAALAAAGEADLAELARRAAAALKEPGATAALGVSLARRGWQLAKLGQREEALARLREAKAMLVPQRTQGS